LHIESGQRRQKRLGLHFGNARHRSCPTAWLMHFEDTRGAAAQPGRRARAHHAVQLRRHVHVRQRPEALLLVVHAPGHEEAAPARARARQLPRPRRRVSMRSSLEAPVGSSAWPSRSRAVASAQGPSPTHLEESCISCMTHGYHLTLWQPPAATRHAKRDPEIYTLASAKAGRQPS